MPRTGNPPAEDAARVRIHLSRYHLYAAFQAASQSVEIEGDIGAESLVLQHRAQVIGAVTSAVAFLESCINELLSSAEDSLGFPAQLGEQARRQFEAVWSVETFRRGAVLGKYDSALVLAGKRPLVRGGSPYQDAHLLTQLRNALVHYSPTTAEVVAHATVDASPDDFARRLSGRFPENPLAARYMIINPVDDPIRETVYPFFPERCLGAGCASWACMSALRFADHFFLALETAPPYEALRSVLPNVSGG